MQDLSSPQTPLSPRATVRVAGEPPLVSFIVPAYNAARTIDVTLRSIQAQSFADWEAVIVDDGSSDRTFRVCEAWCRSDRRFRVIRQPNAGASAARNTGIAHARGRWLAFLDSDDWVAPDHLETLLALLEQRGEDHLAYCSYVRVGADGEHLPPDFCASLQERPFEFLAQRCEPAIHCVLVSRERVQQVGGFDPALSTCEDWDLWLKLARAGIRFVGTPAPLAFYRMRSGSLSTSSELVDRDALVVLERARSPDPRVPCPHPQFAGGFVAASHDDSFGLAIASAAASAASGADVAAVVAALPAQLAATRIDDWGEQIGVIADVLLKGYCQGANLDAPTAALAFERLEQALRPLVEAIEAVASSEGYAELLLDATARLALATLPLEEPTRVRSWVGLEAELSEPLPDSLPLAGATGLYVRATLDDERVGELELPLFDAVGATLAREVVNHVSLRRLLWGARLPYRPAFWLGLAREAGTQTLGFCAQTLRHGRTPRRLTSVARDALRAGARAALRGQLRASPCASEARARQLARAAAGATAPHLDMQPPSHPPAQIAQTGRARGHRHQLPIVLCRGFDEPAAPTADELALLGDQLAFLRRSGYHALTGSELAALKRARAAPRGRPLLIACELPVAVFRALALPAFVAADLRPLLFVREAELFDPQQREGLRALRAEGIELGFACSELLGAGERQLCAAARARAILQRDFACPAPLAVTPEEMVDGRLPHTLRLAGYDLVIGSGTGLADLELDSTTLPSITASREDSLGMFAEKLRYSA